MSISRSARRACRLAALALLVLTAGRSAAADAPPRPRLAVLVVFDQMRGDYLTRWHRLFGVGGFHRLEEEGAWFPNCNYPYAVTLTGAGHASILTGCSPDRHGIVGNDWYDRGRGAEVGCVDSDRYVTVPGPAGKKGGGFAPGTLRAPALGDALKEATGGKARVIGLSFKERAAILPAGRRADACYWFDGWRGTFVTSSYYRERLPEWLEAFNRTRPADRWFAQPWTRLRPDVEYVRESGPDDVPGEGTGAFQGRTFPHRLNFGQRSPGALYYKALYNSPFGNDLLLDLVEHAVEGECLGTRDVPDLLCVSFSSNDAIGHVWGPDSQEVLDVTLRSDRTVRLLLEFLDARVGKGRYVLALTADHGVCPLPEVARAAGKDGVRVSAGFLAGAEDFLRQTYGTPERPRARWIEATSPPWLYLNRELLRERGLKPAEVEDALTGWLKRQPDVQTAYGRTQLLGRSAADDPLLARARRSFYPERSGDVLVILKPYHVYWPVLTGTTHGTPHPYDTHVPLLVYGPGVKPGVRTQPVTPQAAAAVLARALGAPAPAAAEAAVPEGLFAAP